MMRTSIQQAKTTGPMVCSEYCPQISFLWFVWDHHLYYITSMISRVWVIHPMTHVLLLGETLWSSRFRMAPIWCSLRHGVAKKIVESRVPFFAKGTYIWYGTVCQDKMVVYQEMHVFFNWSSLTHFHPMTSCGWFEIWSVVFRSSRALSASVWDHDPSWHLRWMDWTPWVSYPQHSTTPAQKEAP